MIKFYFAPLNKLGNIIYRKICLNHGADFVFSEMIRLDKLIEDDVAQSRKIKLDEEYTLKTIFQVMSEDIENLENGLNKFYEIIKNPIEINYNMGCPQSSLAKNFVGGGILKDLPRVEYVCKTLSDFCITKNIIPSIKIRLGPSRDKIVLEKVLDIARDNGINKVYVHGRCLRDGYNRPATFDEIKIAVKNHPDMEIVVNGDIKDYESFNIAIDTGCSSVLIGRAALEDPRIFNILKDNEQKFEIVSNGVKIEDRMDIILEFLTLSKGYDLPISFTKGNLAYLTRGVIGGSEFRNKVNDCKNIDEILKLC